MDTARNRGRLEVGNFADNVQARENKRTNYLSNPQFRQKFQKLLGGSARKRALPGMDMARGLGQAKAGVAGRGNVKQLRNKTNPVTAALQHASRNRSVEQGGNNSALTQSAGAGRDIGASVLQLLKDKGIT